MKGVKIRCMTDPFISMLTFPATLIQSEGEDCQHKANVLSAILQLYSSAH